MKSFTEIIETICMFFHIDMVDETSDIVLVKSSKDAKEEQTILIQNSELKEAYINYCSMKKEQMQLYDLQYYELAVQVEWFPHGSEDTEWLEDNTNKVAYHLGYPSNEYCIMLMDKLSINELRGTRVSNYASFWLSRINRSGRGNIKFDFSRLFARVFGFQTIRIKSDTVSSLSAFQNYAKAFEYLYMFKTEKAIVEVVALETLLLDESGGRARATTFDEPPRRRVNPETLEFYSMAVEARDPFTKYISFYHVIEYYFDDVYKRKIIAQMRDRITDPSFSYKSDKSIYELAKFANKKMKNDDLNGRGNELESLKYVLTEYVSIESLIDGLKQLNPTSVTYYAEKNVSFAGTNNKISWNDSVGVYTTIAKRVYETRNALVHTKSTQSDKQYKPQRHKELLKKEIPLIQVLAEIIITSTSSVL